MQLSHIMQCGMANTLSHSSVLSDLPNTKKTSQPYSGPIQDSADHHGVVARSVACSRAPWYVHFPFLFMIPARKESLFEVYEGSVVLSLGDVECEWF